MPKTKPSYFESEDILHLALSEEQEAASVELSPDITAELNADGELIGVEILEASRYRTRICRSEDDDLFVAAVPELPGCIAHGATVEEALAHCREAVELWIETARELGRDIPDPH